MFCLKNYLLKHLYCFYLLPLSAYLAFCRFSVIESVTFFSCLNLLGYQVDLHKDSAFQSYASCYYLIVRFFFNFDVKLTKIHRRSQIQSVSNVSSMLSRWQSKNVTVHATDIVTFQQTSCSFHKSAFTITL